LTQPLLGIAASAVVMTIAIGFIALFDFPMFAGWVAFFLLCLIPMQIVVVVLWGANPSFASRLGQPARGTLLIGVTALVAALVAPLLLWIVGEGVGPPGPIPSHFVIIAVPTTFFLAIAWGGWPFTRTGKGSIASGLLLLAGAYVLTYSIFRVFFNYDFLRGAPMYLSSAPEGLFNGVMALVFYVTALAVMFLVLCFDLWPLTTRPAVMRQPALGLVWTALSIGGAAVAMWIGVGLLGVDPMVFLTQVTAPFIFGTIIVLNMLQGSLFGRMAQPLKGLLNSAAAAAIGIGLALLYSMLAPFVTGTLPSGPPGYEHEIWLANALLSVTFPFLIFHAAYFGFWPLRAPAPERRADVSHV
jgi:hypothetical protein